MSLRTEVNGSITLKYWSESLTGHYLSSEKKVPVV